MKSFLAVFLLLNAALLSSAQAATFCVATVGSTPQCLYEDLQGCLNSAASAFSSCVINPDAMVNYWGGQRFCAIDSSRVAECIFNDRSSCNAAAMRRGGICIDNMSKTDDTDPYLYDNRVQR